MKQMKEDERLLARGAAGLSPGTSDIKEINKDPTVGYVSNPCIKSNTELITNLKAQNVASIINHILS